jgi:ribosomal protein S18 acetylase RimI-like enzyme
MDNRGNRVTREVEVRTVEPGEAESAVAVQVMAFASDPVIRWLFPEPQAYLGNFAKFAVAFGGRALENDSAHVANDFGGAAFWLPPGVYTDADAVEEVLSEALQKRVRSSASAMLEEMDKYHIQEPHWYLPMIGVDPAHQGEGIGSALLRHALAQVDEKGLPAYLEASSPANVPLYQRHGFEVLGEIRAGEAPPFFPMHRPAR